MRQYLLAPLFLFALLAGCQSSEPAKPETTAEAFTAAYSALESGYSAIGTALAADLINRDEARDLIDQADEALSATNTAYTAWQAGEDFPDDALLRASAVLNVVHDAVEGGRNR